MVVVSEPLDVVEYEPDHGYDRQNYERNKHEEQTGRRHTQLCPVNSSARYS